MKALPQMISRLDVKEHWHTPNFDTSFENLVLQCQARKVAFVGGIDQGK